MYEMHASRQSAAVLIKADKIKSDLSLIILTSTKIIVSKQKSIEKVTCLQKKSIEKVAHSQKTPLKKFFVLCYTVPSVMKEK
jgi:hypothetical protein